MTCQPDESRSMIRRVWPRGMVPTNIAFIIRPDEGWLNAKNR